MYPTSEGVKTLTFATSMPLGHLPLEIFQARRTGRRPWRRLRTPSDNIPHLTWEHLWIPQDELENVAGHTLLSLLSPRKKKRMDWWMDGWMDGITDRLTSQWCSQKVRLLILLFFCYI